MRCTALLYFCSVSALAQPLDFAAQLIQWHKPEDPWRYQRLDIGNQDFRHRLQQLEWQHTVTQDLFLSLQLSKKDKVLSTCPNSHKVSEMDIALVPTMRFTNDLSIGVGWHFSREGTLKLGQREAMALGSRQGWLINAEFLLNHRQNMKLTFSNANYLDRFSTGQSAGEGFTETALHLSYQVSF
ncbi:hypothetical protein GCM10009092_45260 [Bowmanella denitrificans]|uniref:Outer membrane protein beta-barrel domain-containing protein n=1 Tax=Bowmanella denitrificans TaxID=366582 RepID=A0ABP3HQ05_9ALTE